MDDAPFIGAFDATKNNVWLIDPLARTVEVHRLEAGQWMVVSAHAGDDPLRAEPFGAVALDPSRWWLAETAAGSVSRPA